MTEIFPPYFHSYGESYEDRPVGGGGADAALLANHFENYATGEISCLSMLNVWHPGDHFWCTTGATSIILIYFEMPATGRFSAWSHLECVGSSYSGSLEDEWGWSDADINQTSRYFMMVGSPPDYDYPNFYLLNYHRGEDEGSWSDNMAQPGEFRYCNFISNASYSAGQWVLMTTGINDYQNVVVNDMEPTWEITNSWIIRKLTIDVIPQ